MAKKSKGGLSCAALKGTDQLIKKPRAEDWEKPKQSVEFGRHEILMAEMEKHLAMICENQMDSCIPSHNGTAKKPRSRWRRKGPSASTP
jgi:hypothetical protein